MNPAKDRKVKFKGSIIFTVLILFTFLAGCQTLPKHRLHHSVISDGEYRILKPQKTVLLPLDVKVKEFSSGGLLDEIGSSTSRAKSIFQHELPQVVKTNDIDLVKLPATLSAQEQAKIEEYVALYNVVAANAIGYTGQLAPQAWKHKIKHFDYTLGPGLQFLKEKTGADTALFITGEDVISTSGRKAAFVIAAIFGVAIPLGHTFIVGGMVDLETGDILWLNHTVEVSEKTFLKDQDVNEMLTLLYQSYPGIEEYKKVVNQ